MQTTEPEIPQPQAEDEGPNPWEEYPLRGRLLFVEDSRTSAAVTAYYLEQFGLTVKHVTTAEAAIADLGYEYDLVLSDFFLDGELTGLDLVKHVRGRGDDLSLLPILMLTSAEEADHRISSLRAGANDFIYKPFLPEELFARLHNLLSLRHAYKKLYTQKKAMERLSITDGLTNLYNKRFLSAEAPSALDKAQRQGRPLAVLIADLDHFKHINDDHGHEVGDVTLRSAAQALEEEFQEVDLIARYGGEEFVVLMDDTSREQAAVRANRFRQHMADLDLAQPVTVSLGVASQEPDEGRRDYHDLFREADQALYEAKGSGRNQVGVWDWRMGEARIHRED